MKSKHLLNMSRFLGLVAVLTFLTALSDSVAQPAQNNPSQARSEAGDRAWQEVLDSIQPPEVPAEWRTRQPGQEEIDAFTKKNAVSASTSAEKAREFYTAFPNHPKVEEARQNELELLELAVQFGKMEHLPRVEELLLARAGDPALDAEERFELRTRLLQIKVRAAKQAEGMEFAVAEFENGARALRREFPERPEVYYMLAQIASLVDPEKARAISQEILDSPDAPAEVKEASQVLLAKLERIGKPLEIEFTSLDGKKIDLQQMKGKVVLIDFWATWCQPCITELPNLKAAYEKLHPDGFEILGISLDRSKADLERFLRREKLPWVHHFDEEGKLSQTFEIASIPTMWLVDKKGNLRDMDARSNLVAKAEKLLAE